MFDKKNLITDLLLIAACLLGALLASLSLFREQNIFPDGPQPVATVNGVAISEPLYRRVINGMQNQKKSPLQEQDLLHVRDKLIEEELLIQRGQELGFLQLHGGVRREMLQAVMETIVAENQSETFDEQVLHDYFESHKDIFLQSSQIRVRRMQFDNEQSAKTALQALTQSESFEAVEKKFAVKSVLRLPDTLLSTTQLRQYTSADTIAKISALDKNQLSRVINENQQWYIYQLLEKTGTRTPEFKEVKELVTRAYLRDRDEKSLQQYLDWLKKRSDISMQDSEALQRFLHENE